MPYLSVAFMRHTIQEARGGNCLMSTLKLVGQNVALPSAGCTSRTLEADEEAEDLVQASTRPGESQRECIMKTGHNKHSTDIPKHSVIQIRCECRNPGKERAGTHFQMLEACVGLDLRLLLRIPFSNFP